MGSLFLRRSVRGIFPIARLLPLKKEADNRSVFEWEVRREKPHDLNRGFAPISFGNYLRFACGWDAGRH